MPACYRLLFVVITVLSFTAVPVLAEEGASSPVQGVSILTSLTLRNDVLSAEEALEFTQDTLNSHLNTNLGVGYTWRYGFHAGFMFLRHQRANVVSDNDGNEVAIRSSFNAVGPRFGYESSFGLSIYYSYLMQAKETEKVVEKSVSSEVERTDITRDNYGYLFEIGYGLPIGRFVRIGPQFTYLRRGYRSSKSTTIEDGVELPEEETRGIYRRTLLQPQLGIWVKF